MNLYIHLLPRINATSLTLYRPLRTLVNPLLPNRDTSFRHLSRINDTVNPLLPINNTLAPMNDSSLMLYRQVIGPIINQLINTNNEQLEVVIH